MTFFDPEANKEAARRLALKATAYVVVCIVGGLGIYYLGKIGFAVLVLAIGLVYCGAEAAIDSLQKSRANPSNRNASERRGVGGKPNSIVSHRAYDDRSTTVIRLGNRTLVNVEAFRGSSAEVARVCVVVDQGAGEARSDLFRLQGSDSYARLMRGMEYRSSKARSIDRSQCLSGPIGQYLPLLAAQRDPSSLSDLLEECVDYLEPLCTIQNPAPVLDSGEWPATCVIDTSALSYLCCESGSALELQIAEAQAVICCKRMSPASPVRARQLTGLCIAHAACACEFMLRNPVMRRVLADRLSGINFVDQQVVRRAFLRATLANALAKGVRPFLGRLQDHYQSSESPRAREFGERLLNIPVHEILLAERLLREATATQSEGDRNWAIAAREMWMAIRQSGKDNSGHSILTGEVGE